MKLINGGWLMALILALVCVYMYVTTRDANIVAPAQEASVTGRIDGNVTDTSSVQAELDAAKEEVAVLRAEVAKLQAGLAATEAAASPTPETAATDDGEGEGEAPEEASAAADDGGESRGERIANAQLAIVAEMTYQGLFDELGLAPEVRDTVKGVIGAYMTDAQKIAAGAMQSKDQKAKDVHARLEKMEADLRAELASSLTAEELEAWDAYEPVADQMLYERLVDGQLNMMAAGLADENRVLASQVMAEELVREFDVFEQSDELYTMDNYNDAQERALQASLERLSETLAQDQYDLVDGFVRQAIAMFDAMSEQKSNERRVSTADADE